LPDGREWRRINAALGSVGHREAISKLHEPKAAPKHSAVSIQSA
jgi:hypothetical protein